MSVEGCGEPGGSPRLQEEGGFAGGNMVSVHPLAGEHEPKASVAHARSSPATAPGRSLSWGSRNVPRTSRGEGRPPPRPDAARGTHTEAGVDAGCLIDRPLGQRCSRIGSQAVGTGLVQREAQTVPVQGERNICSYVIPASGWPVDRTHGVVQPETSARSGKFRTFSTALWRGTGENAAHRGASSTTREA